MVMSKKSRSFSLCEDNIAYIEEQWPSKGKRSRSHWLDDLITHLREKSGKKPTSLPVVKSDYQYPAELNTQAWEEWKQYRREMKIKAYKPTPRSEGAAINNLIKMSGGDHAIQAAIIQQSMANGYQGLFELKGGNHAGSKQAANGTSLYEQSQSKLAEWARQNGVDGVAMGVDDSDVRPKMDPGIRGGADIYLDSGDWETI